MDTFYLFVFRFVGETGLSLGDESAEDEVGLNWESALGHARLAELEAVLG